MFPLFKFMLLLRAMHCISCNDWLTFCSQDALNLMCENDAEIFIRDATYGRMELGVCGTSKYEVGCTADRTETIAILNRKCATKSACSGRVFDVLHGVTTDCPPDAFSYLNVSYSCQEGKIVYGLYFAYCSDNYKHRRKLQSQLYILHVPTEEIFVTSA